MTKINKRHNWKRNYSKATKVLAVWLLKQWVIASSNLWKIKN